MSDLTLFVEENRPIPVSPREFSIRTIGVKAACELNAKWHSRFPHIDWSNVVRNRHSICYILESQSVAYGVAIWSTPIAWNRMNDGLRLLELRRMALSPECPKNTATWMLAKMQKDIEKRFEDVIRLVSYQDTEAHIGTIYKAANWRLANVQKKYVKNDHKSKSHREQSTAPKARWEMEIKRKAK